MSDIKIVFFDIDSTLYDQNKSVPESTTEAVRALQKKGVITAIATGRAPFMFKDLRTNLDIHTFASFNGSYVVDQDEPIYKKPIPEVLLEELEHQSSEAGNRLIFLNEETMKIDGEMAPDILEGMDSLKLNLPLPDEDPNFFRNHDIYQALLFYSAADDSGYLDSEPLNKLRYVRWHKNAVDVIPQSGSKAQGIKKILEKLNMSAGEACAFGDGNNDVEMLSYVGTGVAMGNAVERAKQAADRVTLPVDRDGIYYGLKELGLI
ncbi:Cof-type HAD-IIB family hydrolase [Sporolactobacillus pectinivorans]|uniref:Cof-type HAD-IIB family hydrolase n=1 Tax=Sporolactobacillus pectinivorans TaxID=1591408 RepID=UPI000C25B03F|nr:Cof-type HAD-IIB family hydrolase [Sporolactobacillus pectinivorans]